MDNTKTLTLLAIGALFLCGWFITAQTSDVDAPDMQSQCSGEFKYVPIFSASDSERGNGYYEGCNGTLYRINYDRATGVSTAQKVSLED